MEFPGVGKSFSPTVSGNPNRLRVRKFANAGGAEFSAKAGTFHTAEWQTRIGRDHGVDKDHSGVQLGYEKFLFFAIISPGARTQAEYGVVRELKRLVNIAYAKNSCDRAEEFFAVRRRIFGNIDKNGGLIEKSRPVNTISAGQQFCPCRDRFLHLIVHALQNLFRCEWPDVSFRIHGVAKPERAHAIDELLKEMLVNLDRR